MKIRSILAATLLIGSSLAFAQTCPTTGSTCLVPARATSSCNTCSHTVSTACPTACPTVATTVPYTCGTTCGQPMVSTQPFYVVPQAGIQPTACGTVTSDATSLMTQVAGLRNDVHALQGSVRAAALEIRGQQLLNRMNSLMASELQFRQQLALNPNLPNARTMAFTLSQQADAINIDSANFARELSLIPVDQRPYLAPDLNAFTVAYWTPSMQQFADYRNSFGSASLLAYQPAFASNPWLQGWQSNFQTSLGNLGVAAQNYASINWWSGSAVAGSMECYPNPNAVMVPSGSVIYIPANSLSTRPSGICPAPAPAPACPPTPTITTPPSTMGNDFYNTTTPGAGTTPPEMPTPAATQPPRTPSRGGTGY